MISFIIYLDNNEYIGKTLADIKSKTPKHMIGEIIICNKTGIKIETDNLIKSINAENIDYPEAWNVAWKQAKFDNIIFINHTAKVGNNWTQPLINSLTEDQFKIVSPVVYTLDPHVWKTEENHWNNFSWRWDLKLYNRPSRSNQSPSVSPYCFAIHKNLLAKLGDFDSAGPIEMSLRCWLNGGSVEVVDDSMVAVNHIKIDQDINKLSRMIQMWMPEYQSYFYQSYGAAPSDVQPGKFDRQIPQTSVKLFVKKHLPELEIYELKGILTNKSVAIVNPGPSFSKLNKSLVYQHDVIIGIDYIGMMLKCDYNVTNRLDTILCLTEKYRNNEFILPFIIEDRSNGKTIETSAIFENSCKSFEISDSADFFTSPPFHFDSSISAIQLAIFLGSTDITIYCYDNKFIGDLSHPPCTWYADGKLLKDNDATKQLLALNESRLSKIGGLALDAGVNLFRHNVL